MSDLLSLVDLYSANQASIALNAVDVATTDSTTWDVFEQQGSVYNEASANINRV